MMVPGKKFYELRLKLDDVFFSIQTESIQFFEKLHSAFIFSHDSRQPDINLYVKFFTLTKKDFRRRNRESYRQHQQTEGD